jgi:hypothetical protein
MEHTEQRQPPDVITSDTDNATKVQPKEAPAHKRAKFRRFRAYNRGTWNGPKRENKQVIRRQDDLHRYDSLASTLLLNQHQKQKGRRIFDSVDVTKKSIGVDALIFGVCVVVANADVEDGSRYYPNVATDGVFLEVAESLELDESEQISAIEKVTKRTDISDKFRFEICPVDGCNKSLKPNGVKSHVINVEGDGHGDRYKVPDRVDF